MVNYVVNITMLISGNSFNIKSHPNVARPPTNSFSASSRDNVFGTEVAWADFDCGTLHV